jgi:hypothetical protein
MFTKLKSSKSKRYLKEGEEQEGGRERGDRDSRDREGRDRDGRDREGRERERERGEEVLPSQHFIIRDALLYDSQFTDKVCNK